MCLGPELLISMALNAAGSAINASEQRKTQKRQYAAKENALRLELDRQDRFQKESALAFDDTLNNIKQNQSEQGVGDLVAKRDQALQEGIDNAPRADFSTNIDEAAPKVVKDTIAARLAEAVGKSKDEAKRLAKLRSFGDQRFENSLALSRGGADISTVGNFARQSAALNPYEQREAYNNAYKAPSGVGDLLSLAGQGLGYFGASGGSIFPKGQDVLRETAKVPDTFQGPFPQTGPYLFNI